MIPARLPLRLTALIAAALMGLGFSCSETTEPGDFELQVAGGTKLERESVDTVPVAISHSGDIGGVELSLPSLPTGITGAFNKSTIGDDDSGVLLILTTAANAPLGGGTVRIAAKGASVDYSTDVSVVVEVKGTYSLEVPPELSIDQDETKSVTVSLAPMGGFEQVVALTVGPATTGMTASITPASISGSQTATLTFTATTQALTGTKQFSVAGATEGLPGQTRTINVTVSPKPAVTIMGGGTLSVTRSSTGSFAVSISRTNFAGDVSIAVAGLPAGVTIDPNPISLGSQSNGIAQITTSNATPGTYTLTLSGTAGGIAIQSVTMTLTVIN